MVLLDKNVTQLHLSQNQSRQPFNFKWGPADKNISDAAYQSGSFQFKAVGQMPLAPCHVDFEWGSYYPDLLIKWFRRDRALIATSIDLAETPMSENTEAYDVEIMSGSTVVRTFSVPVTSVLYTAAMQAADFPSGIPNPLIVNIYQISATVGRGWCKTAQLWTR